MNRSLLYNFCSTILIIFLVLFAAEATFLPESNGYILALLIIMLLSSFWMMFKKRQLYYDLTIKTKGLLYSQAIVVFALEMISYMNEKGDFLNTPSTLELFKWGLTLVLFLSIIRVIRPLSFEEWWSQKKSGF